MTKLIEVRNVHEALPEAIKYLEHCLYEESRNGSVYVSPVPVDTLYSNPTERVIFWSQRDANPYFHFFEGLWMLWGCNDVAYPARFAKQIAKYSDNGKTLSGAYGHRWRSAFDFDQLDWVIKRFKIDPSDRRVVLTMWSPNFDPFFADQNVKDIPCNTEIYFRIIDNWLTKSPSLCMKVNCRSNDIFWGAYGANAVHMSMLQEYLALSIGVKTGWYIQSSFNWHAYVDFYGKILKRIPQFGYWDDLSAVSDGTLKDTINPYLAAQPERSKVSTFKMIERPDRWNKELDAFINYDEREGFEEPFFKDVAVPLILSHEAYKKGNIEYAIGELFNCKASDWRTAAQEWLLRRRIEKTIKNV